jgi:hypothetical protein
MGNLEPAVVGPDSAETNRPPRWWSDLVAPSLKRIAARADAIAVPVRGEEKVVRVGDVRHVEGRPTVPIRVAECAHDPTVGIHEPDALGLVRSKRQVGITFVADDRGAVDVGPHDRSIAAHHVDPVELGSQPEEADTLQAEPGRVISTIDRTIGHKGAVGRPQVLLDR